MRRAAVFLNCPFDRAYTKMFRAIVFGVIDCGFDPRCALDIRDDASARFDRICRIMGACGFGIHDISRTGLGRDRLPRFNMPFELGLFLGDRAQPPRGARRVTRPAIIFDRARYRYQKFISDLSGCDLTSHESDWRRAIEHIRDFLAPHVPAVRLPGGRRIVHRFIEAYDTDLPRFCRRFAFSKSTIGHHDFKRFATEWIRAHPLS